MENNISLIFKNVINKLKLSKENEIWPVDISQFKYFYIIILYLNFNYYSFFAE